MAGVRDLQAATEAVVNALEGSELSGADRAGRDVVAAARSIRRASAGMDRGSPFRRWALSQAGAPLERVADELTTAGSMVAVAVNEERANVELMIAREDVADAIDTARRGMTVRTLAQRSGLAVGYVSNLGQAKAGPPSEEAAAKLDTVLLTAIAEIVSEARGRAEELRAAARETARKAEAQGAGRVRDADRLAGVTETLSSDRSALDLVEEILGLPRLGRVALTRFIASIRGQDAL